MGEPGQPPGSSGEKPRQDPGVEDEAREAALMQEILHQGKNSTAKAGWSPNSTRRTRIPDPGDNPARPTGTVSVGQIPATTTIRSCCCWCGVHAGNLAGKCPSRLSAANIVAWIRPPHWGLADQQIAGAMAAGRE